VNAYKVTGPHGCHGTSKTTGEPCRNYPGPGAICCRFHGGAAPQVKAKAARRLAEAEMTEAAGRYVRPDGSVPPDIAEEITRLIVTVTSFTEFAAVRLEAVSEDDWQRFDARTAAGVAMLLRSVPECRRLLRDVAKLNLEYRLYAARQRLHDVQAQALERVLQGVLARYGIDPAEARPVIGDEIGAATTWMQAQDLAGDRAERWS
jgi:hypothetical protein